MAPCSLVTKAEAAKALGVPASRVKRTRQTGFPPGWDCRDSPLPVRPLHYFQLIYRDYTDNPSEYEGLKSRRFAHNPKQPGIGEAAFGRTAPLSCSPASAC